MKTFTRLSPVFLLAIFVAVGSLVALNKHSQPVTAHAPHGQIVCPLGGSFKAGDGLYDSKGNAIVHGKGKSAHKHQGFDMGQAEGSPVYATVDGTIEQRIMGGGGGNSVILKSNGHQYVYMHLSSFVGSNGSRVSAGTQIGKVGHSGVESGYNHVHFEIWTAAWKSGSYSSPSPVDVVQGGNGEQHCVQPGSGNPSPSSGGTVNNTPKGSFDGVDCKNAWGWAFDPDNSSASVNIHVYFDAPAGQQGAVFGGSLVANQQSDDVNNANHISGNHRFTFPIPDRFKDGQSHAVIAYAIDTDGGTNTRLGYKSISGCRSTSSTPTGTTTPPPSSSSSIIIGEASGRCLDVVGGSTNEGAQVQLWDCNGNPQQKWTRKSDGTIVSSHTGYCLDADKYNTGNGAAVRMYRCSGQQQQRWNVSTNSKICSSYSGRCLDATGPSTANGTIIQQWEYLGGSNQRWSIR